MPYVSPTQQKGRNRFAGGFGAPKKPEDRPYSALFQPDSFRSGSFGVSKSTPATPVGPSTADIGRSFAQGIGKGYLATGQALSAPFFGATLAEMRSKPLVHDREDTFLGQLTRNLSGTDKPISLAQEDIDLLGEDYGKATGGNLAIAFGLTDLVGGSGVKGIVGLSKAMKAAKTAEEAAKALRAAGFAADLVEGLAPRMAKLDDLAQIEKELIAAEKLQNTTKSTAYTPVAGRSATPDPLIAEARKYASAEEFVAAKIGGSEDVYRVSPLDYSALDNDGRWTVQKIADEYKVPRENVYQLNVSLNELPSPKYEGPSNPDEMSSLRGQPAIKVVINKKGVLEISDGNHRIDQAIENGDSHIPAWVVDKSQLTDIYNKAQLPESPQLPLPPKIRVDKLPTQTTTTGSQTKQVIKATTGYTPVAKRGATADPLIAEARKYGSAEEFVDSKIPITRRTVTANDNGTPRIYSKQVGGEWTEQITGAKITNKEKIRQLDTEGERQLEPVSKIVEDLFRTEDAWIKDGGHLSLPTQEVLNKMKDEGLVEKVVIPNPYTKGAEDYTVWKLKPELTDIYNKAQLPESPQLPLPPKIRVDKLPTQTTTTGSQTKQVIKATTEGPKPRPITQTEKALLKSKLRSEVRASRAGYKKGYSEAKESITNRLRNTFGTKIDAIRREGELAKLKTNVIARDADRVRGEIVDFVKNNIPKAEQGKFLVTVRNAKTQKDLIKAFIRIDARASQINLKEAIADLKKTAEKLSESPSISADYRNKIKDILNNYELSGHTNATIAKLEATQAYLKRMEEAGEDVDIPQRILEKLKILGRTPKENLTLAMVQRLQAEIELLGKLGKTKWKTKQALYEGEKALRKEELLNTATPINSKVYSKPVGQKPNEWIKRYISIQNYWQKNLLYKRPMDGFAEVTGMLPAKQTLDANHAAFIDRVIPGVENFKKLETDMLEAGHALTEGQHERVGVYALSRRKDGYEKLANGGITRAEADAIVLTAEEQKFLDSIYALNDATFEPVKKYMQDVYNVDVGKAENYMSYQTDFEGMADIAIPFRFGEHSDEAIGQLTKKVEEGFTKAQTGAGNQKIQINALKIAQRHSDDVAFMLTTGRDTKMYFEIVNSPEMVEKLGDVGALGWLEYLDLYARKGGAAGAERIAALDIIRKNMSAGILGYRLSTVLIQHTSFIDNIGTIGLEHALKGAKNISTSKAWRGFIMDNFPEIRTAVGDDIAFRQFDDSFMGKLNEAGFKGIKVMDGVQRSFAAAGAYEKLARQAGIAVDFASPNKELIAEATRLTRHSQGSSFWKDQPLLLTGGGAGKKTTVGLGNKSLNQFVLSFQSFALNHWDNVERQIWRMGIKEKKYGKAATAFFWLVVVAAATEEGLRRTGKAILSPFVADENESEEKPFIQSMAMNAVQTIPMIGNIASALEYSSSPVPAINAFGDVGAGIISASTGKHPETQLRGAIEAAGGVGSLLGVAGSSQIAQLLRGAVPKASGGDGSEFGKSSSSGGSSGMPLPPSLSGSTSGTKMPLPPSLNR